jgi:hypothetical protein
MISQRDHDSRSLRGLPLVSPTVWLIATSIPIRSVGGLATDGLARHIAADFLCVVQRQLQVMLQERRSSQANAAGALSSMADVFGYEDLRSPTS